MELEMDYLTSKILSAEDITSDYGFLLRLVNTFTIGTDEYYPMCYKVNDDAKDLYIILRLLTNHLTDICILQISSFNWGLSLKL